MHTREPRKDTIRSGRNLSFVQYVNLKGLHRWVETNCSKLSLRVAYQMPANLDLYVGPAGVWGDVNDILQSGLDVMKVTHIGLEAKLSILWECISEGLYLDCKSALHDFAKAKKLCSCMFTCMTIADSCCEGEGGGRRCRFRLSMRLPWGRVQQ